MEYFVHEHLFIVKHMLVLEVQRRDLVAVLRGFTEKQCHALMLSVVMLCCER